MAQTLDELKTELYETFNRAVSRSKEFTSFYSDNGPEKLAGVGACIQAAAQAANAIVNVEHEIAVQKAYEDWKARGGRIEDEIKGGIVRDVKALAQLKIKPVGGNP